MQTSVAVPTTEFVPVSGQCLVVNDNVQAMRPYHAAQFGTRLDNDVISHLAPHGIYISSFIAHYSHNCFYVIGDCHLCSTTENPKSRQSTMHSQSQLEGHKFFHVELKTLYCKTFKGSVFSVQQHIWEAATAKRTKIDPYCQ